MNTNAAKIIDALGGTAEVARLFGVRMPSISSWRVSGIPGARMMYLQAVRPDVLQGVDVQAATAHSVSRLSPEVAIATTSDACSQVQEVAHG